MNKLTKQSIFAIVLGLGVVLGVSSLQAAGSWTAPSTSPPGGNVDAPVNVGTGAQLKTGALSLSHLFTSDFTFATGTPVAGQVLTALDSTGQAGWATPSAINGPAFYHAQDNSINRSATGNPLVSSGGLLVGSVTFTPKSATDLILVEGHVHGSTNSSGGILTAALYNGAATTPIADSYMSIDNDLSYADPYGDTSFSYEFTAGTTAPITMNLRGGDQNSGTFYLNKGPATVTLQVSSLDVIDIPN